jgi:hypothetical protein
MIPINAKATLDQVATAFDDVISQIVLSRVEQICDDMQVNYLKLGPTTGPVGIFDTRVCDFVDDLNANTITVVPLSFKCDVRNVDNMIVDLIDRYQITHMHMYFAGISGPIAVPDVENVAIDKTTFEPKLVTFTKEQALEKNCQVVLRLYTYPILSINKVEIKVNYE